MTSKCMAQTSGACQQAAVRPLLLSTRSGLVPAAAGRMHPCLAAPSSQVAVAARRPSMRCWSDTRTASGFNLSQRAASAGGRGTPISSCNQERSRDATGARLGVGVRTGSPLQGTPCDASNRQSWLAVFISPHAPTIAASRLCLLTCRSEDRMAARLPSPPCSISRRQRRDMGRHSKATAPSLFSTTSWSSLQRGIGMGRLPTDEQRCMLQPPHSWVLPGAVRSGRTAVAQADTDHSALHVLHTTGSRHCTGAAGRYQHRRLPGGFGQLQQAEAVFHALKHHMFGKEGLVVQAQALQAGRQAAAAGRRAESNGGCSGEGAGAHVGAAKRGHVHTGRAAEIKPWTAGLGRCRPRKHSCFNCLYLVLQPYKASPQVVAIEAGQRQAVQPRQPGQGRRRKDAQVAVPVVGPLQVERLRQAARRHCKVAAGR